MNHIAPTPNGHDLVVAIQCTTLPTDEAGESHFIRIRSDWTVETEHDLGAERVSRALGGWCSCLHFAESTVRAYRHILDVMHAPNVLERDSRGKWLNTTQGHCEHRPHHHASLRDAVRHEISTDHAGLLYQSKQWRVQGVATAAWNHFFELLWQVRKVWAESADPRIVRLGAPGYLELWREGLLPSQAARVVESVPDVALDLPTEFFVNAHFNALEHLTYGGMR
jgi:hypothetical protein